MFVAATGWICREAYGENQIDHVHEQHLRSAHQAHDPPPPAPDRQPRPRRCRSGMQLPKLRPAAIERQHGSGFVTSGPYMHLGMIDSADAPDRIGALGPRPWARFGREWAPRTIE